MTDSVVRRWRYTLIAWHGLTANQDVGFPVAWGDVSSENLLRDLLDNTVPSRALVFADRAAWSHHSERLRRLFGGIRLEVVEIESRESDKNEALLGRVISRIAAFEPLRRSEPVFVVGGGVLMDVVGFACSMYARGTPYVRIPTTVIGQVDAGVGLKTGINVDSKKNRLGAFYPPLATLNDPSLLASLPSRQISNGLGEVIKVGVARDVALCVALEDALRGGALRGFVSSAAGVRVLVRSAQVMTDELSSDPFEANLCRAMDFGHTFSPHIELDADDLLHGEAVAIDIHLSSVLAYQRGLISQGELDRVRGLLRLAELPIWDSICATGKLWSAVMSATRHRDGMQRMPLPSGIGEVVFVNDLSLSELESAVSNLALVAA